MIKPNKDYVAEYGGLVHDSLRFKESHVSVNLCNPCLVNPKD